MVYKGKVGTGFDTQTLKDLAQTMASLAQEKPAAEVPKIEARGAHWTKPKLVAEVAFAQFTGDGRIRHGSFIGLRGDKKASDVTPERSAPSPTAAKAKISPADRVLFPESGQTKDDLAGYYTAIAPLMLPFAANRPLSLVRCPQRHAKACFFQKHDSGSFGPDVSHVPIVEKDGGAKDYLYLTEASGLLACVQIGTIEFHGWGTHKDFNKRFAEAMSIAEPDRFNAIMSKAKRPTFMSTRHECLLPAFPL